MMVALACWQSLVLATEPDGSAQQAGAVTARAADASPRTRQSLNHNWKFARFGPQPDGSTKPEPGASNELLPTPAPESLPAGTPGAPDFDDSNWKTLDVPHDWAIAGPFREDLPGDTGKLPWKAIGWYRKHFTLPASDKGKRVYIDFDGAMANAQVWLNGRYIGTWPYGYASFRLELTDQLKFGADNVLAVRLDTVHWGSRWYPGGGIYRNVWLVKTAPVHVGHWGVFVTTPVANAQTGSAKIATTIDNQSEATAVVTITTDILENDPNGSVGRKIASIETTGTKIPAGKSETVIPLLTVKSAKLWDVDSPNLYIARTTLATNGKVIDVYDQPFGFRTFEFTPRDGLYLNGRRVQIKGTCNHHDLGPLGAAFNVSGMRRQLTILKEMGDNALRTSHNPPAPELLELADRMGFLVMDEAFDCWAGGKSPDDYSRLYNQWHKKDLQALVRRDRNHPSVIIWSIGNEIPEQNRPEPAMSLANIVRAEDSSRPVSAGCNSREAITGGLQKAVDIFGVNYNCDTYRDYLARPGCEKLPFFASESVSAVSSRGVYFFPVDDSRKDHQVSSYDVARVTDEFSALDHYPAFGGEFVWTGFDYLGEPTPYNQSISRSSYFGIVDLCGFKKDRYYLYQAHWRPDFPMAHILPHWNWPDRVGKATPVVVYTSGDEAELFLNGRSLGRKKRDKFQYRFTWDNVVYQPGVLKVVAYKNGKQWVEETVRTTGPAAKLALSANHMTIAGDGRDLCYVTVAITDKDGLTVPTADNLVKFSIEGPGEIVAVGNGDSANHESFVAKQHKAFNGLCLAIIRTNRPATGSSKAMISSKITLKATAEGLAPAAITILSGLAAGEATHPASGQAEIGR